MYQSEKPKEECGVFAAWAPGRDVARLTFFGLYALQHRGQESAGIATCDEGRAIIHKGMGLVSQVFTEPVLSPLKGTHAIGHTRYSTTGASELRNAQPFLIEALEGPLGLAHNGNITNAHVIKGFLLHHGIGLSSSSDSELVTRLLALPVDAYRKEGWGREIPQQEDVWIEKLLILQEVLEGAFCLVLLTREGVYGVRDPQGFRPLCLGTLSDGGAILASESCALLTVGASFEREIAPGEVVKLSAQGVQSIQSSVPRPRSLCSFEHVYFSRPDSLLDGELAYEHRVRLGRRLAQEMPCNADVVVGVPDSAIPHAIGFSAESGIPYSEGLIKNRYIGRTFIQPDAELRKVGVRLKYNPLASSLQGKRVVLVDDSVVRGTTSGPLVSLLREAGAVEVHMRVASPPVKHPCFMGVDMPSYDQFIAHKMSIPEICRHIGVTTLGFLSPEGLLEALQGEEAGGTRGMCRACFTGEYPLRVPHWLFDEKRPTAPTIRGTV